MTSVFKGGTGSCGGQSPLSGGAVGQGDCTSVFPINALY